MNKIIGLAALDIQLKLLTWPLIKNMRKEVYYIIVQVVNENWRYFSLSHILI